MSGKKLIIIVGALALVSFTVAFIATQLLSNSSGDGDTSAAGKIDETKSIQTAQLAKVEKLSLSDSNLETLMRTVRQKSEEVAQRDRLLDEREKRLAVTQEALRKDAQSLDNLRVQLAVPLLRLKELKEEIENARVIIKKSTLVNLRRIAKVYEKMTPKQGGAILTGMCRNNQVDDAAKILYLMTEKGAAKMLGTIKDEDITAELFRKLKAMSVEG